eukprot:967580-Pelagomonas_calceolata.AAC.1
MRQAGEGGVKARQPAPYHACTQAATLCASLREAKLSWVTWAVSPDPMQCNKPAGNERYTGHDISDPQAGPQHVNGQARSQRVNERSVDKAAPLHMLNYKGTVPGNGYCRTDMLDHGRHVVCAQVTQQFLEFSLDAPETQLVSLAYKAYKSHTRLPMRLTKAIQK